MLRFPPGNLSKFVRNNSEYNNLSIVLFHSSKCNEIRNVRSKINNSKIKRIEKRVLVLNDLNKEHNLVSAIDFFILSSDYAIQVDSNLATNGNIYNIGHDLDINKPSYYIEWSYKIHGLIWKQRNKYLLILH